MKANEGDRILRQGEQGDTLFVLLSGIAEVMCDERPDDLLGVLGAGDAFGEISFLTSAPRTANVVARAPCEAVVLSGRWLHQFLDREGGGRRREGPAQYVRMLAQRLTDANRRYAAVGAQLPGAGPRTGRSRSRSRSRGAPALAHTPAHGAAPGGRGTGAHAAPARFVRGAAHGGARSRARRPFGSGRSVRERRRAGDRPDRRNSAVEAGRLARLRALGEALREVPGVNRVWSLTSAGHVSGTREGVEIHDLAEDLPRDPAALAALRADVAHRDYRRHLLSEDGGTGGGGDLPGAGRRRSVLPRPPGDGCARGAQRLPGPRTPGHDG